MPSYLAYKNRLVAVLDKNDDDNIEWITAKGHHIPIKNGENKSEAIKEYFNKVENSSKTGKETPKESSKEETQGKETKKSLALKIAELEKPEKISKTEYARRLVEGVGAVKGYSREELEKLYERRKAESGNGSVPKEYRRAYGDMMEKVHNSAKAEIKEENMIDEAVKLSDGKFTKEDVKKRLNLFDKMSKDAKRITTDTGKVVKVDTQQKYKLGGHFENNEWVGGEYTEERKQVHRKILNDLFANEENKKPAKGEKPKLIILGGRGGSGKSNFTKGEDAPYPESKYVVIDPDAFKEELPEYKSLVEKGDERAGLNAWEVHEESSDLKKEALDIAMKKGCNVVLDGTLAKTGSVKKVIDKYKKAGYDIDGAYMHLPREKSTARGIKRAMAKGGRLVPVEQLLGMKENEDNFESLMGEFTKWTIYNNDVPKGEKPKLVAKNY